MKKQILYWSIGVLSVFTFTFLIVQYVSKPRTGFILINDLFSRFEYKKEVERKFLATKNERQQILDSLAVQLRLLSFEIEKGKFKDEKNVAIYNYKREEFYQKKKAFEEDNVNLSNQYDAEVIAQMNQYVSEYGRLNNYEFIFGNDGNGSLMYAYDANNITDEVSVYMNKKYSGK
ncbi:MAG: OmpH family outer membrane protein [Bacteroidetes bacterium]|nr:MAG: OmpH family outer membrane protein [Bacteroidota bacterium]